MKKRILSWSILVGIIIIVAIGIPRITANEALPLGSSEEKRK
ncbi:hypothetical protein ACFX4Y_18740 [Priestia sp. YIM B13446]